MVLIIQAINFHARVAGIVPLMADPQPNRDKAEKNSPPECSAPIAAWELFRRTGAQ
ncbi:hypothetical protein AHiyo6_06500 [Arthrobacter sp. Hiyo6]|nr:hypothetical protein AHiyo6_06500 [Arthrobacter sp. Hiyo6]